jgi:oligopeptidase A
MDAETGPWRITLNMPSYITVMQHIQDRAVREEVYKGVSDAARQEILKDQEKR